LAVDFEPDFAPGFEFDFELYFELDAELDDLDVDLLDVVECRRERSCLDLMRPKLSSGMSCVGGERSRVIGSIVGGTLPTGKNA
jgi:hypothetical protein